MTGDETDDAPEANEAAQAAEAAAARAESRSLIERIGLGLAAAVIAVVFGGLAVAALASGEVFIGVMAGIGALMTVWAAAGSLHRG